MAEEQIPGALGQVTLDSNDPYFEQKLSTFEKQIRAEQEKTRANAFVVLRREINDTQTHLVVLAGFVESFSDEADDSAASDVAVVADAGLADALTKAAAPKTPATGERPGAPKGLEPPSGGVGLRRK